jgi:hypothetical protein
MRFVTTGDGEKFEELLYNLLDIKATAKQLTWEEVERADQ